MMWYESGMHHDEVIPILDFGSQYAQLIARRVREKGVYSELVRPDISLDDLQPQGTPRGTRCRTHGQAPKSSHGSNTDEHR